jgi:hypothetical protein
MVWKNPGRDQERLSDIQEMIGLDTANNGQATTLVAANADGSLVERVEYLQSQLALQAAVATSAIYNPHYGFRVTKTEDVNTATSDDLFTLTGKVAITLWTCEVTNALSAAVTDYKIELTTLAGVLVAAGNIASSIVGHMFTLNGDAGSTSLNTSTSAVSVGGVGDANTSFGPLVVGVAGGSDIIKATRTAGSAGDAILHIVYYWPLEAGASLVAAA